MDGDNDDVIRIKIPNFPKNPWFYTSVLLTILLIVSIITGGFSGITARAVSDSTPMEELPDAEVRLTVLNDPSCNICSPETTIMSLQRTFNNMKVSEVDINSDFGKALVQELDVDSVPFFFFDSSITLSRNFAAISRTIYQVGNRYVLRSQGNMILDREESSEPKINLLIMAHEPFSIKQQLEVVEFTDSLPEAIVELNFILKIENDTFRSINGEPEINEELRQVCVMEYFPESYYDYISCHNVKFESFFSSCVQAYRTCSEGSTDKESCVEAFEACMSQIPWEKCLTNSGIDTQSVMECSQGDEGRTLLEENSGLSRDIEVIIVPTAVINDKYKVTGLKSFEQLKEIFCSINPGFDSC